MTGLGYNKEEEDMLLRCEMERMLIRRHDDELIHDNERMLERKRRQERCDAYKRLIGREMSVLLF